jgi:hypothetical protein
MADEPERIVVWKNLLLDGREIIVVSGTRRKAGC